MSVQQTIDLLDAAVSIAPDISRGWIGEHGSSDLSRSLLSRLEHETPFALPITVHSGDDGLIVEGDISEVALSAPESDANAIMVAHCHAMLMLSTRRKFAAHCRIVDADGKTALPIGGEKRIPRENSPAYAAIARNREIVDAVAATVGATTGLLTSQRVRDFLNKTLRRFSLLLDSASINNYPQSLVDDLNAVTEATNDLVAPPDPTVRRRN